MDEYDANSLGHRSADTRGKTCCKDSAAFNQCWGEVPGCDKHLLSLILLPLEIHKKTKGRLPLISVEDNH